jgi:hypothetical protein
MKIPPLLIALLIAAVPVCAAGQTSTCQSIQNTTERLACYDRATPPVAPPKQAAKSKSGAKPSPDQAQLVDQLAVENSRLDAKLKTICRGC